MSRSLRYFDPDLGQVNRRRICKVRRERAELRKLKQIGTIQANTDNPDEKLKDFISAERLTRTTVLY